MTGSFLVLMLLFCNRILISKSLFQFKPEVLFPQLKLHFRNQSLVLGMKALFPKSKLFFQDQIFVPDLLKQFIFEASFPNCYYNSNSKIRFKN